jgi:hypothetical protein
MADLINNAVQWQENLTPATQTSSSPIMSLLSAFMSNTQSPPGHGSKTQQTEREIYEIIQPQTKQTENELSEHSS